MLISTLAVLLVSCGGGSGSGSNSNTTTIINNGVAQKGPFSIGSNVIVTELNSAGIPTGESINTKITSKSGKFSFATDSLVSNAYYRMKVTGNFLNENTGSVSEDPITLLAITNSPKNSSINILTHWLSHRTDVLLADGKTLKTSLDQSQSELLKLFGINHSNALDITKDSSSIDEDNALLLLLSGALMEASSKYKTSPQTIIDEFADDFSDDGQLNEKGDDWFIRLQSLIKGNPYFHTKKYAKEIREKLGYDISLNEKLPTIIPLASRPVANVPSELIAEPSETITLDGSASNDSGDIINFTWFRVDQQTQYDIQVSDRFSATPMITVPDEETVLAAPNQEISLLYALVVTDADKLTHTGVVKVIIRIPPPLNNPPVANSQRLITDEDTPIAITLTANDIDGDTINYVLSTPLATSNGIVLLDAALGTSLPNIIYNPTPNFFGTDSFTFLVNDGFANSNTATVDIQINPINDPPIADAGVDQTVESLQAVLLNGSGIDLDGTIETYLWEQTGGSLVNLSDSAIPNPEFTAPDVASVSETLSFDLIVTDNDGLNSIADSVEIFINPMNIPPVANAGVDQDVISGELVILNGSGTDVDGNIVGFTWSHSNTAISLSDASISNPTFTAPSVLTTPETFTFDLVVTDDDGDSSIINSVDVVVNPPDNNRPIANAGPDQNIVSIRTIFGSGFQEATLPITLDASASSDIEDATSSLTFDWTFVSGPVSIDPDNLIMPALSITGLFNQDIDGDYVFSLVVTDSDGLASEPDQVTITVGSNLPPVANNLTIPLDLTGIPTPVTLVGNDPDGNNANLIYEIVSLPPAPPFRGTLNVGVGPITGNSVEYQSNSISSPDPDSFTYRVRDELGAISNLATVNLTIPNNPPIPRAGPDQTITAISTFSSDGPFDQTPVITLDGSSSTDFEDPTSSLSFNWTFVSGPSGRTTPDPSDVINPVFRISGGPGDDISGDYVYSLEVTDTDGTVSEFTDEVTITVISSLVPLGPTADAGPDGRLGYDGESLNIDLDGSASSDPNGLVLTYSWERLLSTAFIYEDDNFDPDDESTPQAFSTLSGNPPATVTFRLTVTNSAGASDTDDVIYTIQDIPSAFFNSVCFDAFSATTVNVSLTGRDPDGDDAALRYIITSLPNPSDGTLNVPIGEIVGRTVIYTPLTNGSDPAVDNSFTFTVIDEQGWESAFDATVNLDSETFCP